MGRDMMDHGCSVDCLRVSFRRYICNMLQWTANIMTKNTLSTTSTPIAKSDVSKLTENVT